MIEMTFILLLENTIKRLNFIQLSLKNLSKSSDISKIEPKFLRDVSSEMLAKIDGITNLLNGYLILFNINGIPKFCTTDRNKLSDNVILQLR